MEKDILATLKKHIDSGAIEPTPKEVSRAQIHTFGENMKGINEFIGAVQMLSLNLNKIKNLSEKIEWINDLLSQESNENTASMLRMQRNAHIANIKYVCGEAKFLGVNLFGTNLNCVVRGKEFAISVENPLNLKGTHFPTYCTEKLLEIEDLMQKLNNRLHNIDDSDNAVDSAESAVIGEYAENLAKIV